MRYHIGDHVVVRHDLTAGASYYMDDGVDWNSAVDDMVARAGETVVIEQFYGGEYMIKGCGWRWTDDMFEGFEDSDELHAPTEAELSSLF